MILATKLLLQRINDIMFIRFKQGKTDITPSIIDLERTHIIYVNAQFKPFAAIGYEYNKVKPQSGTSEFKSGVQFPIPQFGDFFHDMVCHIRISNVYAALGTIPSQNTAIFPINTANPGADGYRYNIVDAFGNIVAVGSIAGNAGGQSYRNFVRYCEYPGNRLFTSVKFDVNGNPLDSYDQYVPVMLEKFTISPNKYEGYCKLVG